MDYKGIVEKRQELYQEIQRFRKKLEDDTYEWSAEDESNWSGLNGDFDKFTRMKTREEQIRDIDNRMKEPTEKPSPDSHYRLPVGSAALSDMRSRMNTEHTVTADDRSQAMRAWGGFGKIDLNDSDLRACQRVGINPSFNHVDIPTIDNRAYAGFRQNVLEGRENDPMSTTAGVGGETIPTEFMRDFEKALLAFGGMRQVSRVVRTASGAAMTWPTANDTAVKATIVAEAGALDIEEVATSSLTLNAYKYNSLIKVSSELLQDSAFNLESELGMFLGERIGRGTNTDFTLGSGSEKPRGVEIAAIAGSAEISTATTAVIAGDDLISLFHAVDPAYRQSPSCRFMMNDFIASQIRKITEGSTGNYLWQPGLQASQPDVILGKPVVINQDQTEASPGTVAQNDNVCLFGDFSKYIIREASTVRIVRLNELYMGNDQVGFTIFWRGDGDLLDAGTKPIYNLTIV